jgi:hypothetical protein
MAFAHVDFARVRDESDHLLRPSGFVQLLDFQPTRTGAADDMKRWIHYVWLVLAVALIGLAGARNRPLNALKREHRLVRTDPLENAPPIVAFTTVVLGGFRGILADLLWLHLSVLQEQGKYFELVQLADWITKLEPRFPEVWAFHAWNLAYNVSVLFDQPQDRWRWVRSGIELLRDEGIPYNPGEAQLYRELGWLFQHKLGADYDQAHVFYKQSWAREMADLLGGPPTDFEALMSAKPTDPAYERAQKLLRHYKLNPAVMRDVDRAYGPFDWRLPYPHAIYWAWRGRPYAEGFERVAVTRMILQCQAAALRQGKLVTGPDGRAFALAPDISLLPKTISTFKQAIAEFPEVVTFRESYPYLLSEATLWLYLFGKEDEAREMFGELSKIAKTPEVQTGFESFIFHSFVQRFGDSEDEATPAALENAALASARWKLFGEDELAQGYRRLAEFLWQYGSGHSRASEPGGARRLPPLQQIFESAAQKAQSLIAEPNTSLP